MKNEINYGDFEKLDVRVGEVVSASEPEWSDKLLRYEVNLGEEIGTRVLFSGIRKWYGAEEILGKKIPVIINLAPKKMGDEMSQGMALMADGEERPFLFYLPENLKPGTVIR